MASGWAKNGSETAENDALIQCGLAKVRSIKGLQSTSRKTCRECGNVIPLGRRKALEGVQTCIKCAE